MSLIIELRVRVSFKGTAFYPLKGGEEEKTTTAASWMTQVMKQRVGDDKREEKQY